MLSTEQLPALLFAPRRLLEFGQAKPLAIAGVDGPVFIHVDAHDRYRGANEGVGLLGDSNALGGRRQAFRRLGIDAFVIDAIRDRGSATIEQVEPSSS